MAFTIYNFSWCTEAAIKYLFVPDQLSLELMLVTHYNKDTLYRFDLDTFSYTYITVQTPDNKMPRSIAYDPVEMRVYWSAVHWNQVKDSELLSSYLNGTENRRIGNVFHSKRFPRTYDDIWVGIRK